ERWPAASESPSTPRGSGPPSCAPARSAPARPAASGVWPSPTPTRRCATSSSPGVPRPAAPCRSTASATSSRAGPAPTTTSRPSGGPVGKYEGMGAVRAALGVRRPVAARGAGPRGPLELVCWTNEEGARFPPPMVASGAFAGVFDVDWVHALRDDDGRVFGAELERIGYLGKAAVGGRSIDAYFELHIEQGPILDREAVPVGIVVGGYATRGMHVDVHGETAHAGPTPMDRRKNALVGAAMLAVAINDVGWKYHATEGKATVARLVAWPNKAGILSEYAQVTCDVR